MNRFLQFQANTFQFPGQGKAIKNRTALHLAVLSDDAAQLEFLLTHNASPNARDAQGHTPFHYAIASRNIALAERLLEAGADINVRDRQRRTILTILTDPKLAKLPIDSGDLSFEQRVSFLQSKGAIR